MDMLENFDRVRSTISAATERCRRAPGSVRLVVVSKTWPAEILPPLIEERDHLVFGENRVQEAMEKIPQLPSRLEWHLVGPLQKNKIRKALPLFSYIHSVDSTERAVDINRIAAEEGVFPKVLLQVNLAGEAQKHGFSPFDLEFDLQHLLALPRLEVLGLMLIPPLAEELEATRPHFRQLRELRDRLESKFGTPLPELSMGMSHDYEVAIEEGATMVRIGSAIFGERRPIRRQEGP